MVENSEDSRLADNIDGSEAKSSREKGWLIAAFLLVSIFLVAIIAYAMLSTAGIFPGGQQTQPAIFIAITNPTYGDLLDMTWAVNVSGEAGGLFEGSLVVQALDATGNVLAQQPTTINAPNAGIGGAGSWSVDLRISAEPGTQGQIKAFSTSPVDGSVVAEASVDVGYGESPSKDELLPLEDHLWRLNLLKDEPLIENTLITLQLDNFQASGSSGCNLYNSGYERGSTELNISLVTSTAKECELPDGIMTQEAAYFSALEGTASYRIENQKLNLFSNSGDLLLVYEAVVMGNILNPNVGELPEDALVNVQLSDISITDVELQLIGEHVITDVTQFPIPFIVSYNPREIIQSHSYAIGARIEDSAGNLLFINPTINPVITAGNPSQVNVTVDSPR